MARTARLLELMITLGTRPRFTVQELAASFGVSRRTMILSYEAFLRYAESPFAAQSVSAITKLRAALPPDVVRELDRIAAHVVVLEPTRDYRAPLLADLLAA